MKRNLIVLACAFCLLFATAACSSNNKMTFGGGKKSQCIKTNNHK